jgi:hypothetical protein
VLTRADFGVVVCGRVDSVGDLTNRTGKTKQDKDYSFWQQTASLTVGGEIIEVVYRSDSEPVGILCPLVLDEIVRVKVTKPRVFNGKTSFDIVH